VERRSKPKNGLPSEFRGKIPSKLKNCGRNALRLHHAPIMREVEKRQYRAVFIEHWGSQKKRMAQFQIISARKTEFI